jgi:hypothetical protein
LLAFDLNLREIMTVCEKHGKSKASVADLIGRILNQAVAMLPVPEVSGITPVFKIAGRELFVRAGT